MSFDALDIATKIPPSLRAAVAKIRLHDRDLADQIRRAVNGIALQISEGSRREGRDRLHLFRTAAGSASETRTALELAEGWGLVDVGDISEARALLDRVLAMLWRLTHR